ncbi:HU family DNA-binding protein [Yoonia sp. 2307UL14-13]|uniref:HU family DNA-binding protein n=1 Tax=Yoonia sp. 2307UL14-13 TaxID=3126506 RepID=UPI0030B461AD
MTDTNDDAHDPRFKKPHLLEQVVARTNLKKRDVKPAVEASLAVLGEALARGDEVVLPPLGKLRVVKTKDLADGAQVMTLKLRTPKDASRQPPSGLADAGEDG